MPGLGHLGEGGGDLADVAGIGPLRRQRRSRRLDHQPDLEELVIELRRRHGTVAPAQHFRIEQIPVGRRHDPDAGAGFRFDKATGRQRFDRLADHRPARSEFAAEIGFDREWLVMGQIPLDDTGAQILDDMCEKIALLRPPQRKPWMFGHGYPPDL